MAHLLGFESPKSVPRFAHFFKSNCRPPFSIHLPYSDAGQDSYERQYQERVVRNLHQRAKALGFDLVPNAAESAVT